MPRVKTGFCTFRHKKILSISKGFINRRSKVYKVSKEAVIKSFLYSFRDRKIKKRFYRKFWIVFINFFLRIYNLRYNFFFNFLNKLNLSFNRKTIFNIFLYRLDFLKFLSILFFYYYYIIIIS